MVGTDSSKPSQVNPDIQTGIEVERTFLYNFHVVFLFILLFLAARDTSTASSTLDIYAIFPSMEALKGIRPDGFGLEKLE